MVSASLVITTMIHGTAPNDEQARFVVLVVSRGVAVVLLALYAAYLVFELRTHAHLFVAPNFRAHAEAYVAESRNQRIFRILLTASAGILVTFGLYGCASAVVRTLPSFLTTTHLSKAFVGTIMLPLVGNVSKGTAAVASAREDRMDLAIAIAIGSALQTAMFVAPSLVLTGYLTPQPMTLYFGVFETVVLCLSTFVVNLLIQDGKSNFLEGALCLAMYVVMYRCRS